MKHGLYFFLIFCLFSVNGFSQNKINSITGYVYDSESKQNLVNVNIYTAGKPGGAVTNKDGYFKFELTILPAYIYFSHIGYKTKQILIEKFSKKDLRIYLDPDIREIEEVVVSGEKIVRLFKKEDLYILDYEIQGNYLIFLANVKKNPRNSRLYLASLSGDTISSRKIQNPGNSYQDIIGITHNIHLFKDCFGEVHICTKDKVWQIFIKEEKLWLIYPSTFPEFYGYLLPMKTFIGEKYYYQIANTTMVNTYYDKKGNSNRVKISTVTGPPSRSSMLRPRLQKTPFFNLNDNIVLFNFHDNQIEFFSKEDKLVKVTPISFHKKNYQYLVFFTSEEIKHDFKSDVIMDEVLNIFYAVFEKAGVYYLNKINLETGNIDSVIKIPEHPFIDKIMVRNNVVYFLYQNKFSPYYMSIFRMQISDHPNPS